MVQKITSVFGRSLAAFIVIVIGSYVIVAQSTIEGEWSSKPTNNSKGEIQIRVKTSNERSEGNWGNTIKVADVEGQPPNAVVNGAVNFRLVRDAGTFVFIGNAIDGKGTGNYTFTPNMAFADALRSRGFNFDRSVKNTNAGYATRQSSIEEKLMTAALVNVTMTLADDLLRANFGELTFGDLITAAIFKIDGAYLAEMRASGFPDLKFQDVVKAKIFKIDGEYVRAMNQAGMGDAGFDGLVKFKIFKVTPEYLTTLRAAGLNDLSTEDVVKLKIFNIDAEFVRNARSSDPNVTIQQIVNRKLGVDRIKVTI